MATSGQTEPPVNIEPPNNDDDPPEQEKSHHDGFTSSGDELEQEPMATENEETVELVIVDPNATVRIKDTLMIGKIRICEKTCCDHPKI